MLQVKVVPVPQLALIEAAGVAAGGVLWALRVNRFRWPALALVVIAFGGLWLGGTDMLRHSGFAAPLATGCAFIALWAGESRRKKPA